MTSDAAVLARQKTEHYCDAGYNCAEAVFLTFRELLAPQIEPQTVRLFTAFGSGIGESGCVCGALVGAVAAINILVGRDSAEQSHEQAFSLAKQFTKSFTGQYYVTCCRAINPHPFDSPEFYDHVREMSANVSSMLMDFLIEKGLYHQE